MQTLSDYFGAYLKRGDVGIEIEIEAEKELPALEEKNWRAHKDPSLRGNCMEYVTANPIPLSTVEDTLSNLFKRIEPSKLIPSFRTSVHVHKNMLKYSPLQAWNAICAYWILEDLLFNFCGESRKHSTFCLRLRDGLAVMEHCLEDLKGDYPFKSFKFNDQVRYSGINLSALRKFGSVEFRGMRGTTDMKLVQTWVEELSKLVDVAAVQFEHPEELLDVFFNEDKEKFVSRFLSFNFTEQLFKLDPKWIDTIQDGAERVLPVAYACDWGKWTKKMEEKFESEKGNYTIGEDHDPIVRKVRPFARNGGVRWGAQLLPAELVAEDIARFNLDNANIRALNEDEGQ